MASSPLGLLAQLGEPLGSHQEVGSFDTAAAAQHLAGFTPSIATLRQTTWTQVLCDLEMAHHVSKIHARRSLSCSEGSRLYQDGNRGVARWASRGMASPPPRARRWLRLTSDATNQSGQRRRAVHCAHLRGPEPLRRSRCPIPPKGATRSRHCEIATQRTAARLLRAALGGGVDANGAPQELACRILPPCAPASFVWTSSPAKPGVKGERGSFLWVTLGAIQLLFGAAATALAHRQRAARAAVQDSLPTRARGF